MDLGGKGCGSSTGGGGSGPRWDAGEEEGEEARGVRLEVDGPEDGGGPEALV